MPGHREFRSDHRHGVVINNKSPQCPVQPGSVDLRRARGWGPARGALAPDVSALYAFVATYSDMECCWSVSGGFVGTATQNGVANIAVATPRRHQSLVVLGRHFKMALCAVMCWPIQVRSRVSSRQNVVRLGVEKVGWATSRSFVWSV